MAAGLRKRLARGRAAGHHASDRRAHRGALREARPGDLIVVCADDAAAVYQEAMALNRAPRRGTAIVAPGEMAVPEG